MTPLRNIAVQVTEEELGRFRWRLSEQAADAASWTELDAGKSGYDMWIDALTAGCAALVQIVPDERVGPRQRG